MAHLEWNTGSFDRNTLWLCFLSDNSYERDSVKNDPAEHSINGKDLDQLKCIT